MEENENNQMNEEEREELVKYLRRQWIYKTIAVFVVLGCIIGVASSATTYYFTLKRKNDKFVESTYKIESGTTAATDAIPEVTEVLSDFADLIDDQYIGDIEKSKLINETVKGFVKGLGDEYSEYMTKEDWEEYQEDALGNYSGVGIIMTADTETGYILVTNVIKDSPAEKAGILQGDHIVGVDGISIYQETTQEVANKVRGETGTEVTLNISRDGESEVLEFPLTREKVRVYHVEGKMLEDDIGYVYFNTFDDGCSDEFEQEMDRLVSEGAKKVILDLRYNTGGAVDQALQILDLFLEKGQIELITQSATGPKITTSSLTDKKYSFDNIVILTNEYTASASEILTGALIDNGLAKTVGTKTYGKGVMQSVFPLLDGSILKLTTQEYNTPNGTKIHGVGISPDYEIEYEKNEEDSSYDNQLEKAKSVLKGEE